MLECCELGLDARTAWQLAERYPEPYIREKLERLRLEKGIVKPGAWLRRAIEDDYVPPAPGLTEAPAGLMQVVRPARGRPRREPQHEVSEAVQADIMRAFGLAEPEAAAP